MSNVIVRTTISIIWQALLAYSIYILLRGHNEPGGGFIGGLLLAMAFILRSNITNPNIQKYSFTKLTAIFVFLFVITAIVPALFEKKILEGLWTNIWFPIAGKFSSVLIFDLIVYVLVALSTYSAYLALSSYDKEAPK